MYSARYLSYLKTLNWDALRTACFQVHGKKCKYCGRTKALQCHHLRYKNLTDCNTNDVIPICEPCHDDFHKELAKLDHWLPRDEKNQMVDRILQEKIAARKQAKQFITVLPLKYKSGKGWHYAPKKNWFTPKRHQSAAWLKHAKAHQWSSKSNIKQTPTSK